jgi:hypothetical protein
MMVIMTASTPSEKLAILSGDGGPFLMLSRAPETYSRREAEWDRPRSNLMLTSRIRNGPALPRPCVD